MAVLFYTRRVRNALKSPMRLGVDLLLLGFIAALVGALAMVGKQVTSAYQPHVVISLSAWVLPKYTLFSLCRGLAAYVLSLIFTLIYGTIAAHNHRAEHVMIPALDVLQAIPVLGFLPIVVVAMINLFPTREIGLEIACVVMIFTAQVWNMTFSFHGSLRAIPTPLREVAAIQRLDGWQIFRLLEVPAAMIGLVWNSMMSMAGGWFFLTVNEAFTLGDHDYRLPGIGSYMNEAINQNDTRAMILAVIAMVIMIVAVDQLLWRPIVVWSQRFKMEETADADKSQSWVLELLQRSILYRWIGTVLHRRKHARELAHKEAADAIAAALAAQVAAGAPSQDAAGAVDDAAEQTLGVSTPDPVTADSPPVQRMTPASHVATVRPKKAGALLPVLKWSLLILLGIGAMCGAVALAMLLIKLPLHDTRIHARWTDREDWINIILALLASFARTSAAVILGAAWALPVGICIGLSPRWSQRLQPVIQVVASFPAPMLFPLVTMLLVFLHVHFTIGCVALMLLGSQWYILFNVIAGATAIPADLKEVTSVYRVNRFQRWTRLYIPCVFPYLITGLVTAAGGAWNATIVSEYISLPTHGTFMAFGLGSMISVATAKGNFSMLAAGVVTMAVFVVLLNRFFWKRLFRLAEDRFSLNV